MVLVRDHVVFRGSASAMPYSTLQCKSGVIQYKGAPRVIAGSTDTLGLAAHNRHRGSMLPWKKRDNDVTYFARTTFRNRGRLVGIRRGDRRSHCYVIGKTGTGKSTLLKTFIRQDLKGGEGLALVDPHGDLTEEILREIPKDRAGDLIYFDASSPQPLGFNPLASIPQEQRALAASGILEIFNKLWIDSWGPRLEHILRNSFHALLDYPDATMADILRLLTDKEFRIAVARSSRNEPVRQFWLREFEGYPPRLRAEAIAPVQNKVGAFLGNPFVNRILTQVRSGFNPRTAMDTGKILLVNVAKGKIGEDASTLLGALLVSSLGLAALSRSNKPEWGRRDFYLYLDEFHNFTTPSLVTLLSELRKYRLNLILAHQFLSQLELSIRDAILGNVGTLICFRVGSADAEVLEREFLSRFVIRDIVNLPNYEVVIKLLIDGAMTLPFSARSLSPNEPID